MHKNTIFLFLLLILAFISLIGCNKQTDSNSGSITGKVIPAQAGIKVQAIQNLSLINETLTDEKGNFRILNLKDGNYTLLFKSDYAIFLYDKANTLPNENHLVDLRDVVKSNSKNILMDLHSKGDFFQKIIVFFKSDVSENEINEIILSCNCTLVKKDSVLKKTFYILRNPNDRTEFEIIRDLKKRNEIENAFLDTILILGGINDG